MGKQLGDGADPLLVSVRSGAPFSMPGMMDTVLNLGLNDASVAGLAAQTANERFAFDSYRRFVQMFGKIVLEVPADAFEDALTELRNARGVETDPELSADDLRGLVTTFKGIVKAEAGIDFPDDPHEQLRHAIEAVFRSWNGERAQIYRKMEKISDDLGTAVNVQTMVFGNKGDDSGTGVAFTRDPATGEARPYGDFLRNAQGEDVVAGIRVTEPLDAMGDHFPDCHRELLDGDAYARAALPRHVRHRVHHRAGSSVPAPDAGRQAHRGRRVADGRRDAERRADRQARSGAPRAARAARPAAAPAVRPDRDVRRAREGSQRVARRRGRPGVLHRRRGRRRAARPASRSSWCGPRRRPTTSTA